jgi:hypothetical protein
MTSNLSTFLNNPYLLHSFLDEYCKSTNGNHVINVLKQTKYYIDKYSKLLEYDKIFQVYLV